VVAVVAVELEIRRKAGLQEEQVELAATPTRRVQRVL